MCFGCRRVYVWGRVVELLGYAGLAWMWGGITGILWIWTVVSGALGGTCEGLGRWGGQLGYMGIGLRLYLVGEDSYLNALGSSCEV